MGLNKPEVLISRAFLFEINEIKALAAIVFGARVRGRGIGLGSSEISAVIAG